MLNNSAVAAGNNNSCSSGQSSAPMDVDNIAPVSHQVQLPARLPAGLPVCLSAIPLILCWVLLFGPSVKTRHDEKWRHNYFWSISALMGFTQLQSYICNKKTRNGRHQHHLILLHCSSLESSVWLVTTVQLLSTVNESADLCIHTGAMHCSCIAA